MKKEELDNIIKTVADSLMPLLESDESTQYFKDYTRSVIQFFGNFLSKEEMYDSMMKVEGAMIKNSSDRLLKLVEEEKLLEDLSGTEFSQIELEYICEKFSEYWVKYRQKICKEILGIE